MFELGYFLRKAEQGYVQARVVLAPKTAGLPGDRGFLLVPVEGVDLFLDLGRRKNQFIGTEELHERGPVLPHLLPASLDLLRVAEDQLGLSDC